MDQRIELFTTGRDMLENGFSVIPIDNSQKTPMWKVLPYLYNDQGEPVMRKHVNKDTGEISEFHARGWTPFQTRRATERELCDWIERGAQLAVVGGSISGGLLIIDFDMCAGKTLNMYHRWVDPCEALGYGVSDLPTQRTGGGGYQVAVRCVRPGENTKLAWVVDANEARGRKVAIETRAEGGYAVIAPSLHPSGNRYRMVIGQLWQVPLVNQADVDAIVEVARSMNEIVDEVKTHTSNWNPVPFEGESVVEAYNASHDIRAVLSAYGYTDAGDRMHRPGRDKLSQPSVTFKDNKSFHHSSNDPLSDGYWHTPFGVRLFFEFGEEVKLAVREIAEELGMAYERPQPVMKLGRPYCPHHSHRQLAQGKQSGWYCQARSSETASGYCDFWWNGEGYIAPMSVQERLNAMRVRPAMI